MAGNDHHAAYAGFGGTVRREMSRSTPWWPPRPQAPDDAPNVVVILVDDLGYSDLGCFGSEIPTPHIDGLAARGVQFTNFHAQPSCSPTRASLLTGQECHVAGFGFPAQFDPGYPGYAMELPADVATAAELFRANGYATFMSGKWHLAREADSATGGSRDSWPLQRGFDRFYGFIDGFTDFHHPHQLIVDNTALCPDEYPDGYYLTDDLTDRAIDMIRESIAADPSKPFFLYLAHGAVHAPLQAKAEDIERHIDRYHTGWDEIRTERFLRQQATGVVRAGTQLPGRNFEPGNHVIAWDALTDDERRLYARYMAVYAAMVDNLDQNVGRLLRVLDDHGVRDNTIVIVLSDNGASREGGERGTTTYLEGLHGAGGDDITADLARLDLIGTARVHAHYPRGWAMASNTPNRLYKITTHAGGHTVPYVMSWPRRLHARGLRAQYTHVIDVLPTLVEMVGLSVPAHRHGVPVRPFAGTSFVAAIESADASSAHRQQHYESLGSRGYYRDGWEVVSLHQIGAPFEESVWELYNLADDPTETANLAVTREELVEELVSEFDRAAWDCQVYPLADDFLFFAAVRPPSDDALSQPLRLTPGLATIDRYRSAKVIQDRSFTITVALDFRPGDSGILVSHGSLGGGYELLIDDNHLVWTHNARAVEHSFGGGPLTNGTQRVVAAIDALNRGYWKVSLYEGTTILGTRDALPSFVGMAPLEGIDIGRSRRSPVSWARHCRAGAFPFSGTLHSVHYTPGALAPDAPESLVKQRRLRQTTFD